MIMTKTTYHQEASEHMQNISSGISKLVDDVVSSSQLKDIEK